MTGDRSGLPKGKIISHFKPLAKAESALPADVARYIKDESNPSVILKLQRQQVQQAWNKRSRLYPPRDEAKLFTNLGLWRIDQMKRLGDVLSAVEPITYDWGHFGTKKSPDWLRHVVTLWLGHERKGQPLQTLCDLAELGGDRVALTLDILFCRDTANYRSSTSMDRFDGVEIWLAKAQPDIVAAAPHLAADVRAELAFSIGRFGLHDQYLNLLLATSIGSSKKARATARQALTGADKIKQTDTLCTLFESSSPNGRAELVEVAAGSLGEDASRLIKEWRKSEKATKVISAFDRVSTLVESTPPGNAEARGGKNDGPAGYLAVDGSWVELEPTAPLIEASPLSSAAVRMLEPAMEEFNALLAKGKAEASRQQWHWSKQFSKKDSSDLKALAQLAGSTGSISAASYKTAIDWLRWHCQSKGITAADLLRNASDWKFQDHANPPLHSTNSTLRLR